MFEGGAASVMGSEPGKHPDIRWTQFAFPQQVELHQG